LYNILIEFCISVKLLRLIKMCLNETYSRVRVDKNLSDMFPFETIAIAFQLCFRIRH